MEYFKESTLLSLTLTYSRYPARDDDRSSIVKRERLAGEDSRTIPMLHREAERDKIKSASPSFDGAKIRLNTGVFLLPLDINYRLW